MYLYVDNSRGLQDVPAELLAQFGDATPFMLLHLAPERKLARVEAAKVLAGIEQQGFYLQMPPSAIEVLARDGGA